MLLILIQFPFGKPACTFIPVCPKHYVTVLILVFRNNVKDRLESFERFANWVPCQLYTWLCIGHFQTIKDCLRDIALVIFAAGGNELVSLLTVEFHVGGEFRVDRLLTLEV
jgi:hypothetical protein